MPAYYFSIEGVKTGEKTDPATDKLVTLLYQKIDLTTGETLDVMVIHRVWESSEKDIVTTFYNQFFRPGTPVTQFIPVGLNLDYTYEMLLALFRKYSLPPPTSYELYYQRPRFDLRPIVVLLNNGRFAGASLDAFSLKKGDDRHMEKWCEKKEFGRVEHYVREEATRFLKMLQYLSKNKSRMGITLKEAHAAKQTPLSPPTAERQGPASPPRAPARPERTASRAAESGKPVPRDRPTAAKKATHTLLPAPERTAAQKKRSPVGRNQLAKHPSSKNAPVKKGPAKRR
ncbi:MAG: hypothetical protein WC379_12470 [Methanoregula sp.]|jgi:hypothetical protein